MRALLAVTLLAGACATPRELLGQGDRALAAGDAEAAFSAYHGAARRGRGEERIRARIGEALAEEKRNNLAAARHILESVILLDEPGVEAALYHLGRIVESDDRPRAVGLYYRAAAAAQRRGGGFPYREATQRILNR